MRLGTVRVTGGAQRIAVAVGDAAERAVVSYLSGYQTLEPGDIIAMGTALKASSSGGGALQNVEGTELGGPIEVTISGLGTLSNPVETR
jgi:2-keto-4-pentenoate hydratase/2-oxohepta-3-ene-1,7-dioic acid hydratase in catechol pathway